MIKYDVLNRYTGKVQFTAEIDCKDNDSRRVKITAAFNWAIKNEADLSEADLSEANLSGADLSWANLRWANLRWADLSGADLRWADLSGADLSEADLSEADLSEADLRWADLRWANLRWADLSGANLREAVGNNKEIKTVQSGKYSITFSASVMAIGCEQHTIKQWWRFSKKQIAAMDSGALEWWTKWKPILKAIVEDG